MLRHGSLFSGIGGFDLAARWAGWTNVFHVEKNEFGRRVLEHHFPESQSFEDVTTFDGKPFRGSIDVISGGFPCQPFSTAGKRLGTADPRHLWPEMLRIISEIRPRFVVGENVAGIVNWSNGDVFADVISSLENQGYKVAVLVLPASAVGAPHRRDRTWFVANADDNEPRTDNGTNGTKAGKIRRPTPWDVFGTFRGDGNVADTSGENGGTSVGRKRRKSVEKGEKIRRFADANGTGANVANAEFDGLEFSSDGGNVGENEGGNEREGSKHAETNGEIGDVANTVRGKSQGRIINRGVEKTRTIETKGRRFGQPIRATWHEFPTQPPICGRNDGISRQLDGITFPKWRTESLKAYGNAVVPQLVHQIFEMLNDYVRIADQHHHQ